MAQRRDGCRWDSTPDGSHTRVYLQGIGHVKVHAHRKVEGRVKTVTLKREGRRLYTALTLVREHDVVVHEALRTANLTRSACGTVEEPGTNVAAKSGLNKSILDAGWAVFLRILTAKAESAGRTVIAVNPARTSQTCPGCGHVAPRTVPPKPSSPAWTAAGPATRTWSARSTF
jgi:transposase